MRVSGGFVPESRMGARVFLGDDGQDSMAVGWRTG